MTATLSVDADQDRSTVTLDFVGAFKLPGADGAVVSGGPVKTVIDCSFKLALPPLSQTPRITLYVPAF
ncbi:hypothetical protein D3C85_1231320 [compost metagenome]